MSKEQNQDRAIADRRPWTAAFRSPLATRADATNSVSVRKSARGALVRCEDVPLAFLSFRSEAASCWVDLRTRPSINGVIFANRKRDPVRVSTRGFSSRPRFGVHWDSTVQDSDAWWVVGTSRVRSDSWQVLSWTSVSSQHNGLRSSKVRLWMTRSPSFFCFIWSTLRATDTSREWRN